jgi:hypothetical protein
MAFSEKETLFNLYSKNLTKNSDVSDAWFICPLCHRGFNQDMMGGLSIEHVIPEKLGGNIKTLTCEKCNKDFGSKLISKLVTNLSYKDIFSGKSNKPVDAQMEILGKEINIEYYPGETNKLNPQPKRSNPKNIAYHNKLFENNQVSDFKLTFKTGYKSEYEQMAVLLISYLLLFRYFGYSYAFNRWGFLTRNTIIQELYDSPLLKMSGGFNANLLGGNTAVLFCEEPREFASQATIQMKFKTENSEYSYTKFLPFLPNTKVNKEAYSNRTSFRFKGFEMTYSDGFLINPSFTVPDALIVKFSKP